MGKVAENEAASLPDSAGPVGSATPMDVDAVHSDAAGHDALLTAARPATRPSPPQSASVGHGPADL